MAFAAKIAFGSVMVTHLLVFVVVAVVCLHSVSVVGELEQTHQHQHQHQHQQPQQLSPKRQWQRSQLDAHNFLLGIAQIGAQLEASTQCGHELERLLQATDNKELWSLKVLDSFGSAPRSFHWGNYFWFSTQDFCDDLNTPYSISFSTDVHDFNVTSPFPLEFTLIYFAFTSPHYIDLKLPFEYFLHLGLCLPRSCNATAIFNYTTLYFRDGYFETQRDFQLQLQPLDMRRPSFRWDFFSQTGSIIYICLCVVVISLVVIAETIHRSRIRLRAQNEMLAKTRTLSTETEVRLHPLKYDRISQFERILMCFRLSENYERSITLEKRTRSSDSFLSAIAGLRTIVCLWVTVFHVYYYSLYAMSNAPLIFAKLEHFALQPVMQACFYVDVFFVMSAFLLVYNFLQNTGQRKEIRQNGIGQNLKLYCRAVLHRYMRLTPVMVITMLLSDMVYDFLNMYSPFRLGENSGIYCKRNWWYNLLYIHNFLDMRNICCSWTWYLACEMQYFLLFTALLYTYAKHPKVTKMAFVVLAFGLVVISWVCNYRNGITFQIDVIHNTLNQLYVKPWVRINPYIGGAITAWILHQLQQKRCQREQQLYAQQRHCIKNISSSTSTSTSTSSPLPTPTTTSRARTAPVPAAATATAAAAATTNDSIDTCFIQRRSIWMPLFWFFSFIVYAFTNFMSYWRSTPAWLVAAIMSFGKLLFALFIGGIIVVCALGRGGILQQLLSMRLLQFLNRFCFSIYMLAPVIVVAVFGLRREATNFTEVGSGMDFLAVIMLSIVSAFLLVLLVEMPMQRISGILLRRSTGGSGSGAGSGAGGGGNGREETNGKLTQ